MCYLNVKQKTLQYEEDGENLICIDLSNSYIEHLSYEEVQDIIKNLITNIINNEE